MITPAIQAEIEKELGRKIQALAPLSAANNAQIFRLSCEKGGVFVAKVANRGLDVEAWMLNYLRTKTGLPVPRVLYSNEHVIIMEFIESHYGMTAASQKHAAELLAELHKIRTNRYGLERDTLIGSLKQPNDQTTDWIAFFVEHRLLYMAREAMKEGKVDAKFMKLVDKMAGKVSGYIKRPNPPSLVHGDIWGGNVLAGRDRIAAFLDPAIYYADYEIELAFIRLFNTFDSSFFSRYNEITPIAPGFEERADIYSLYPLLVHTRLFGLSYARKALKILEKYT